MDWQVLPIPESIAQDMKRKNIWRPDCPVNINSLSLVKVRHVNFDNQSQVGELIVHHKLANIVAHIFTDLLKLKFPINKICLINDYNGDDNLSMTDNNSSAFNFRTIAGSSIISMHSYGLAIDINPLQNPYLIIDENKSQIDIYPKAGIHFLNRHNIRAGMLEPVVEIFSKHGLVWGGTWNNPIDYHHFQVPREKINDFL